MWEDKNLEELTQVDFSTFGNFGKAKTENSGPKQNLSTFGKCGRAKMGTVDPSRTSPRLEVVFSERGGIHGAFRAVKMTKINQIRNNQYSTQPPPYYKRGTLQYEAAVSSSKSDIWQSVLRSLDVRDLKTSCTLSCPMINMAAGGRLCDVFRERLESLR